MKDLRKRVREIIDECDQDWEQAIDALVHELETNPQMYERYAKPVLWKFAKGEVYNMGHLDRSRTWNNTSSVLDEVPMSSPKGVSGEALHKGAAGDVAVGTKNVMRLLDMPLNKCKKKLGEAKRDDLALETNMYLGHAKFNHEKAVFYKEVHDKLIADEKVADKFSETAIVTLADETKRRIRASWDSEYVEEPEKEGQAATA